MNYAIVTKFIGPTNSRGSRVKATTPGGHSITLNWDHALNSGENHNRAAKECVKRHIIAGHDYFSDKAAWVRETYSIHGHKDGYVCIVRLVDKAQEV